MTVDTIMQDGRERVVMDRADYQDLIDARDHAVAMRQITTGEMETIPDSEVDDYGVTTRFVQNRTLSPKAFGIRGFQKRSFAHGMEGWRVLARFSFQNPVSKSTSKATAI